MIGTKINRYTQQRTDVEIVNVECATLGVRCLISKTEYEGGKVHLQVFSPDKHVQVDRTVNRNDVSRVLEGEADSDLPYLSLENEGLGILPSLQGNAHSSATIGRS